MLFHYIDRYNWPLLRKFYIFHSCDQCAHEHPSYNSKDSKELMVLENISYYYCKELLRLERRLSWWQHLLYKHENCVQSPRTYVKSWEWPHSPVTPADYVKKWEGHGLAGHQSSSRFSGKPCFKGIIQRIIGQDI